MLNFIPKKFIFILLLSVTLIGCRWRDDFRDSLQPQILEQPPVPTLNQDSPDYHPNDSKAQTNELDEKQSLPTIDSLSTIPNIKEVN